MNKLFQFATNLPASIPQGIIVEGPEGCGKKKSILDFFQYIQCPHKQNQNSSQPKACDTCANCLKVKSGNHLDLIILEPQGQFIQVDQFREIKKSLYFAPVESVVRFVVINQAHKMNAAASNSILKTLEEPSAHTKFFLITPHRRLLLPTIQSRCQFVTFAPLEDLFLAAEIREKIPALPESLISLLVDWMQGGLKKINLISSENQIEALKELYALFQGKILSEAALIELADRWAGKEEAESLELRLEWFCCLLAKAYLSSNPPQPELSSLSFHANHLRTRLEGNANRKLIALASAHLIREYQRSTLASRGYTT